MKNNNEIKKSGLRGIRALILILAFSSTACQGGEESGSGEGTQSTPPGINIGTSAPQGESVRAALKRLEDKINEQAMQIAALKAKTGNIRYDEINGEPTLIVEGVNFQILSGAGTTEHLNGLGNLIIGYNEESRDHANNRQGSHNLILKDLNDYASFGEVKKGGTPDVIVLPNRPPVVETVILTPINPSADGEIRGRASALDADGDPLTYTYSWTVNGGIVNENSFVLGPDHFQAGDEVFLTVTVSDGQNESSANSDTVIIESGCQLQYWFEDEDGDGFGSQDVSQSACQSPAGFVADDTDCDDSDANVNPGAIEIINGIDDDCDAVID